MPINAQVRCLVPAELGSAGFCRSPLAFEVQATMSGNLPRGLHLTACCRRRLQMTASEPSSNMLLYASAFQPWRSCLQISAAHLQTVFATAATFRSELVCLAMGSMSDDGSMVALQVWFCSSMCWLPSPTSQAMYEY